MRLLIFSFLFLASFNLFAQLNCTNWLQTPTYASTASIGNLNVTGNQITVEGTFNCTAYSTPNFGGNIIAKHTNPANVCYALSPHAAEISTSNNGYVYTLQPCTFELNKTYHVAMVYDGTSLKFYRNGFLMSQKPCSGNISSNNLTAFIGNGPALPVANQFIGNINEVRVWNVARTQAQLQTYMNTSLPNPTTQVGLLAYYTFDNLLNKQGNAAFNGTLNGGAIINATNPNCSFVADSCNVIVPQNCKSSFECKTSNFSRVNVNTNGSNNLKELYNSNGFTWECDFKLKGNIVNQSLLMSTEDAVLFQDILLGFGWGLTPNAISFLISDNGPLNSTVSTESLQSLNQNQWYRVTAVCDYNNAIIKLYLDGVLISSKTIPNSILNNRLINNRLTQIGNANSINASGNFLIDDVRYWKKVRSATEIQNDLNNCITLPDADLVAYFKANEGSGLNAASLVNNNFNASLLNASWNADNSTNCANDNCIINTEIIINDYTPILNLDPCKNILTVGNAAAYNVGDTVLMIQMKGAVIDSTNTANFGTITDYKSAGNYEYNYVKSKTGNQIELKNKILRTYEIPNGKVQLIRVPFYQNYSTTGKLTCLPWDGTVGGVLVFNVANTLTLNNDIDVSGKGFRGGRPENFNSTTANCNNNNFYYPLGNISGAAKGEGIAEISIAKQSGKGRLANGGGGGNDHNAGGAGGSNITTGGAGGKEYNGCTITGIGNGGVAGFNLINTGNKIFLGGGGGSGHANDPAVNNFTAPGGNGGGLVIINSNSLNANGFKIINNGSNANECIASGNCNDGAGGGGSGGSTLLDINTYTNNTPVNSNGGSGGSTGTLGSFITGPGGGGSGGMIWLKQNSSVVNIQPTFNGGVNGVNLTQSNNSWGATPGQAGQTLFNLVLPITSVPFKPNIDSVKINATNTSCSNFNFNGLGYTNTSPIATWQWYFGDGGNTTGQNASHNYSTTNTFTVKLVVTDINGCKDSTTKNITTSAVQVEAGNNQTFCGLQTNVQLNGSTTSGPVNFYSWTSNNPSTTILNANTLNPTVHINTTTTFYLTVNNAVLACTGIDSVKVIINPLPIVQTLNDIAICKGTSLQLTSTAGLNTYHWSPGIYVSDSTIANPIFTDTIPRMLVLTGSNGLCSAKDTINISIKPLPIVRTIKDTLICNTQSINLTTTGANTYSWTPSTFLNSTTSSSPTYLGTGSTTFTSTTYYVTGTASNGCIAKDTVIVNMKIPNSFVTPANKSFCKNESVQLDGANGNSVTYFWQPNLNLSNQNIINPIVSPGTTATYTVNINDPVCNYSQVFPVIVTVNPLPNISISKSNDLSCSITKSNLTASGAQSYSWNSSTTLSSTNSPNTTASPSTTTVYIVTGTDLLGCKDTSSIKVFVSSNINLFELPNTFTPNGDLKNDCFGISNFGNAQEVFFIIYNRWGEKVFETNNINTCWKGYHKGIPAVEGNYVYYISAKTACGNIVKKGNVLLIR